jgi:hypothetical protein
MYEYEGIVTERGLVAELSQNNPFKGDPDILNRLTLCLSRAKRYSEMSTAVQDYLAHFPNSDLNRPVFQAIMKRTST